MDRNLDNRPSRLEYLSDPNAHAKKGTRTKSFDKPSTWLAHSAPDAPFVDKWITRLVTHLPHKSYDDN